MAAKQRQSGIELLKVIAMFLIVISHVTQTLGRDVSNLGTPNEYLLDISHATSNVTLLILAAFRHFGALGNTIFFVCSAWFLCDSEKVKPSKIMKLLTDIWVVSVLILAGFMLCGIRPSTMHILRSFFPTTFSNNWYMTTYILFYAIHTRLNAVIKKMSQKELLRAVIMLIILYGGLEVLKEGLIYGNNLVYFIMIYFMICYMKRYMPRFMDSAKANYILLAAGGVCMAVLFLVTNFAGLRFSALSGQLLHWNRNNNLTLILIAIALFNLSRKWKIVSPFINAVSSLSLLIYIIHENHIVSAYLRPKVWRMLYLHYEHSNLILQVLVYALALFIAAALISLIYQKTIMKITNIVGEKLYGWMSRLYARLFEKVRKWE